ncbi:carotenoid oxygenase family protein [Geitlerinema sp. PCC 7407]|uniref:carotenoid oxygenase family protein n=1 Tax=Geitlerinema sp. PCC 7407 TaxID=1173025 RepID=UPI0009006931|nr:carotenoid oxygenase family protein [Geitlerinema sp. PCC 7407]
MSETTPGIIDLFQVMINFLTGNFRSVFDQDLEKSSENHHLKNFLLGLIKFFQAIFHFFKGDFLEILVWNGKHDLQRWQVTYSGKPVKIIQSTHQIGITEDYILIVDTAFKFAIKELLPSLKTKGTERIESLIREMLNRQQIPDNYVYIIPRSELFPGSMKVEAKRVIIPYEAAHFLVDYKNLDSQIRIHFSHVCGWDAAECITKFDFQDPSDSTSHISREQQQPLYGVLYGPTDVSRLGLYILDGKSGNIIESRKVETKDQGSSNPMNLAIESWAWGPAIFTYRSHSNYAPPNHIEDLYWGSLGCWEELLLPHITDLYEDYKYRELSLSTVQDIARQGRRSNIIHIHTEPPRTDGCSSHSAPQIVNAYGFPDGHYVTSPQFVPAKDRTGSTDGYIVCIVHYGDGSDRFEGENTNGNEIWIFDARTLDEPICKLYHPKLNIGFTVHGTWMAQAERRTAPYYISPEEDYGPLLKDQGVEVKDLFERWVFPRKEPQAGDC